MTPARSKVRRVERHPTTKRTLTVPAQRRLAAMNACAPIVTQKEITNALADFGAVSRASVGYVIHGTFWNADVARVFCELTGTKLGDMWPEYVDERGREREVPLT